MASLSNRRIPTLFGLLILAAGLVGGVFLANSATTGFLPRASPETTPKNLKITNITDTSFTVSWVTDSKTPGYVKYGTSENNLTTTVTDDRDQISGSVGLFRTHHVTLRSLSPSTTYYYKIGTGTQELYDDAGRAYRTSTVTSITSTAKTIYGQITSSQGVASGALVYISSDSLAPLSTLSQATGSFVLSLAQARTKDNQSPAILNDETPISLLVVSPNDDTTSVIEATIAQAQPVPDIELGTNQDLRNPFASPDPTTNSDIQTQSKFTSQLLSPPTESSESNRNLTITSPAVGEVLTSLRPTFFGIATKSATVRISITGASTISSTTKSDSSGAWKYTPTTNLKNGTYTLAVSTKVGSISASSSAAFSIATPPPTAKSSSTTSAGMIVYPSTESGELVSGTTEVTLALGLAGIFFIGSGVAFAQHRRLSLGTEQRSSCNEEKI